MGMFEVDYCRKLVLAVSRWLEWGCGEAPDLQAGLFGPGNRNHCLPRYLPKDRFWEVYPWL